MKQLYSSAGEEIVLGAELGRGGEGAVLLLRSTTDLVAKMYHKPLTTEGAAKIAAMAQLRSERLTKLAAWPLTTLHERPRGPVIGFAMPRAIGHKPIHLLYGPKSRVVDFPGADWNFLIHAATNLVRAFDVVHEHNLVVGDVNHGNVLVSDQGTVMLIDCDSFQVVFGGRTYLCEVGVSTHTPPELQGSSFRGVTRTRNHDAFGLAVLVFQLLFLGRHPFAGVYLGSADMPLERAIREGRFAYSDRSRALQMKSPPAVPALGIVGPSVAALFERAFSLDPSGAKRRPEANEWIAALSQLQQNLVSCRSNPSHRYLRSETACPWCKVEAQSGLLLFGVLTSGSASPSTAAFRLELIWAQISKVAAPGAPPSMPAPSSFSVNPSTEAEEAGRLKLIWRIAMWATSAGSFVVLIAVTGTFLLAIVAAGVAYWGLSAAAKAHTSDADRRFRSELASAQRQLQDLQGRWQRDASDQAFQACLQQLQNARQHYLGLDAKRKQKMQQLQADVRKRQLEKFLDKHRIDGASISGIGPGRTVTLQSWGIETALDVTRSALVTVPGFGRSLTHRLLDWRASVERWFVFDPKKGLDPGDVTRVEQELAAVRHRLEQELQRGATDLQRLSQHAQTQRQELCDQLEHAAQAVAQAEANLRGFG